MKPVEEQHLLDGEFDYEERTNNMFWKGMVSALAFVIAINAAWSIYTQSNRFTSEDGARIEAQHIRDMDIIRIKLQLHEDKFDSTAEKLARIETMTQYIYDFHRNRDRINDNE